DEVWRARSSPRWADGLGIAGATSWLRIQRSRTSRAMRCTARSASRRLRGSCSSASSSRKSKKTGRPLLRGRLTALFLGGGPAPFLPLVVAEAALHLAAVHLAREVVPQARLVDVGEADVRAAQARLA